MCLVHFSLYGLCYCACIKMHHLHVATNNHTGLLERWYPFNIIIYFVFLGSKADNDRHHCQQLKVSTTDNKKKSAHETLMCLVGHRYVFLISFFGNLLTTSSQHCHVTPLTTDTPHTIHVATSPLCHIITIITPRNGSSSGGGQQQGARGSRRDTSQAPGMVYFNFL